MPAGGEGGGREVPQGALFPPSAPLRGAGARAGREGPGVSQAAASGCLIPSWTADRAVPGKERGGVPSRAAPLWQERPPKRGPAAPRSRCGGRRAAGDEGLGPGDRLSLGKGKWTPRSCEGELLRTRRRVNNHCSLGASPWAAEGNGIRGDTAVPTSIHALWSWACNVSEK